MGGAGWLGVRQQGSPPPVSTHHPHPVHLSSSGQGGWEGQAGVLMDVHSQDKGLAKDLTSHTTAGAMWVINEGVRPSK